MHARMASISHPCHIVMLVTACAMHAGVCRPCAALHACGMRCCMGRGRRVGMGRKFTATQLLLEGFLLQMEPMPRKFPQPPKNVQLLGSYRFLTSQISRGLCLGRCLTARDVESDARFAWPCEGCCTASTSAWLGE